MAGPATLRGPPRTGSVNPALRAIDFVQRLLDEGKLAPDDYRRLHVHVIEAQDQIMPLGASRSSTPNGRSCAICSRSEGKQPVSGSRRATNTSASARRSIPAPCSRAWAQCIMVDGLAISPLMRALVRILCSDGPRRSAWPTAVCLEMKPARTPDAGLPAQYIFARGCR